jgi:2,4-dienoyl-CoA reductase-like NADH-dependent reductase (Old Yellow Enzyme family)
VIAADGLITDQLVAYHEARAAGGAGLIVLQVAGVHESSRYTSHVLWSPTMSEPMRRVTESPRSVTGAQITGA